MSSGEMGRVGANPARKIAPMTSINGSSADDHATGAATPDVSPAQPTVGPPDIIGTPLSPTATRVMVLGAGELGKELIIAFQRLGVEVIAVDRYSGAPGQQVAHHAEVIDMTDGDALIGLVEKYSPAYVVPEIEAIATDALATIERRGLAEVIPCLLYTSPSPRDRG